MLIAPLCYSADPAAGVLESSAAVWVLCDMDVVAGARNKVSTYAQRAAASLDEKLVSQERPRVKKCFWPAMVAAPHRALPTSRILKGAAGTEQPAALRAIAIAG